jgi:hypothetical protein
MMIADAWWGRLLPPLLYRAETLPPMPTVMDNNVTTSPPWSTSRTPPPMPRQPRHAHHVFGDCLCTCRFFAYLLGVLANFFSHLQEA